VSADDPFGKNRLLVMCLPHDDEHLIQQIWFMYNDLDWQGFEERDLLLMSVSPENDTKGEVSVLMEMLGNTTIDTRIHERVRCGQDFELVLIGKDTGVKARWKKDFTQEDLFNRIDAMPMRQFEMRQKADKN